MWFMSSANLRCPRCSWVYTGTDRIAAVTALQTHLHSHPKLDHAEAFLAGVTQNDRRFLRSLKLAPGALDDFDA